MTLYILTIATRVMPNLGYLLVTAAQHGHRVEVLALGDVRMRPGHVEFQIKFEYVKKWLVDHMENSATAPCSSIQPLVRPDDLIVVVDGYDVFVRGDEDAILRAWRDMKEPYILLSGECYCWPDGDKAAFFDKEADKHAPSKHKYICAGLFAGTAKNVHHALSLPELNVPGEKDDQRMWTNAYMAHGARLGMAIDRQHRMLPSINRLSLQEMLALKAPFLHFNSTGPKEQMPAVFKAIFPDLLSPSGEAVATKAPKSTPASTALTQTSAVVNDDSSRCSVGAEGAIVHRSGGSSSRVNTGVFIGMSSVVIVLLVLLIALSIVEMGRRKGM